MAAQSPIARGRRQRTQWASLASAILIICLLSTYFLLVDHDRIEVWERDRLGNLASVIEENLEWQLLGIYNGLDGVREDLPLFRVGPDWQRASHRLKALGRAMPGVLSMHLLDAQGNTLASSNQKMIGVNLSSRDYFLNARDRPDQATLYASPPFETREGVFSLNLVLVVLDSQGRFDGLVAATLDPAYFGTLLASVVYVPDMWAAIAHWDGLQLLMYPDRPGMAGLNLAQPGSFFSRHRDSGRHENIFSGSAHSTGEDRLMALRTCKPDRVAMDKPLVIGVGRSRDALYADWRRDVQVIAILLFLMAAASSAGLFFHQRRQGEAMGREAAAQAAIRESVERYRRMVETANEGVWSIDAAGRTTFVNQKMAQMLGYAPEDMIGQLPQRYIHPEDLDAFVASMESRRQGRAEKCERRYLRKDGATIWVLVSASPIVDEEGGYAGSFAMFTDISDRKLAETTLRQALAEARTRAREVEALLQGSRVVLEHKEFEPAARRVFDVCRELLGATAGYVALRSLDGQDNQVLFLEAGGRPCTVDPDLPMPLRGLREEAYRLKEVVWDNQFPASKWRQFMPPGHVVLDNVLFAPLIIEDQAAGVIGLANKPGGFDENDARLAMAFGEIAAVALRNSRLLETLESSEGRYRQLYENMSSGVAVYEAVEQGGDFIFRDLNKAGERICRVKAAEVTGSKVSEAFPGASDMGLFKVFQQVWGTGEPQRLATTQYQDQRLSMWVDNYVYKLPGGEIVAIFDDMTATRQAEDERSRMEAQLRQAQKMEAIGTLAGGIAHDFNNILGAVIGFSEMALESVNSQQDPAQDIREILKAGERARELVRQILTFSRKVEVELKPLNINNEVKRAVELLGRTIPKMIHIETHLDEGLKPVMANANQVEQILLNLATNAQDAMPDGGRLGLTTQNVVLDHEYCMQHLEVRPGSYVLLQVSDTGHGMDEQTREHIFEPFFTTKEVGRGTGLGLSTVYGIVRGFGGHVFCYSEPGLGATFKIYLPVYQQEVLLPAVGPTPPSDLPGGDETILVVDDEEALRRFGHKTLSGAGYHVLTASSGEEALALYGQPRHSIHMVILDLGMPGMGGHKTLKAILEIDPRAKVLIASGYAADGSVRDSLRAGAAGYVAKPFRRAELLTTVRSVLDKE